MRLPRHVGDCQVLVDDAFARVDEDERDVRALRRRQRAQLRVVLDPLALPPFPAQAGRVDEDELALAAAQVGVDRVPRRAGYLGDDHPLLAEQRVQEARLADVRTAEYRDPDRRVRDRRPAAAGQPRDDRVEQVAGPVAVRRRERNRIAEAEPVELEGERVLIGIVDLVGHEDLRELFVPRRDPGARVGQEENEVGFLDRGLRLLGDRAGDRVLVGDVDAAGVDQQEVLAVPFADELLAVARHPRRLVHDRRARLGQPVDEGRLADVRKADDRDRAKQGLGGIACLRAGLYGSVHRSHSH